METNGNTLHEASVPANRGGSGSGDLEARHAHSLANFVHDLRSPLSSILTGIEVLKLSLEDRAKAEKIIGMLERQTLEMTRLLEGLVNPASATAAQSGPVSPVEAPAASLAPRKVLVVEDSRTAADILTLFFKMEGLDVRSAYLGEEAIQLARETKPDVIFLDLGLPDVSGYEVAAKIREIPGGRQCFIVALTGRDEEEDRKSISAAGFDLHVVKPPAPETLREVLRKSAEKAR
ncbi:MAG: response regulator [Verrucomicrobiota bacterium]